MSDSQPDLSQLALERTPPNDRSGRPRGRRVWTRIVLPTAVLLGFVALLAGAAGRQWLPRSAVTVLPVIVKRGDVQQAGTPLFQAPGWIEPRPTSIRVSALASGVIDELLVVEGEEVTKGQPVARLVSIDAELAVRQAEANLAIREAELRRAQAELDAARQRAEMPLHLQVPLADAESALARARTQLAKVSFQITAAEARLRYTRGSLEGKRSAASAVSGRVVEQSQSEYEEAEATLAELKQREPNLRREVETLENKVEHLRSQLELLIEEKRQEAEAEAKVAAARSIRDEAAVRLEQAELTRARTTIKAPLDGRVLSLSALPGTRVVGLESAAAHDSSTVIEMYDPRRLQARVDVKLEDVPRVRKGAVVEIETASSQDVLRGRVLQPTSAASVQKNTLEVKVALINPPPTVRPEMLVKATFLAPQTDAADSEKRTQRIFVPESLVRRADRGVHVWIVDSGGRAIRQEITLGNATSGSLVEVREGLDLTAKLIASDPASLDSGEPVEVTGEDPTMGID